MLAKLCAYILYNIYIQCILYIYILRFIFTCLQSNLIKQRKVDSCSIYSISFWKEEIKEKKLSEELMIDNINLTTTPTVHTHINVCVSPPHIPHRVSIIEQLMLWAL